MLQGVLDGGQRSHDARVVGDGRAVFGERHIEVDADEDPLVGQFNITYGELGHCQFSVLSSQFTVDSVSGTVSGVLKLDVRE